MIRAALKDGAALAALVLFVFGLLAWAEPLSQILHQ